MKARFCLQKSPWLNGKRSDLLLILSAVATSAILTWQRAGLLQWISLVPAMLVFLVQGGDRGVKLRSVYRSGLCFFFFYNTVAYHFFLYMYPMEFTPLTRPQAAGVVLLAWLGLSLANALVTALMPMLFALGARTPLAERYPILSVFSLASLWAIGEWLQNFGVTQLPWARLGLGQINMPLLVATASWFGCYFISFVLVAFNASLALLLLRAEARRGAAIAAASVLLLQLVGGALALPALQNKTEKTLSVAALQGNVGSSLKWDLSAGDTYKKYEQMVKEAAAAGAELILLPETAFPYILTPESATSQSLAALARECEVTLMVGAYTVNADRSEEYNSLLPFYPTGLGAERYDKRHLVPLGEYVPFGDLFQTLIPPLAELSNLGNDLTPGTEATLFPLPQGEKLGALICFDSLYDSLTRASVRAGAEALLLPTNDSWYRDSAATGIHNAHARLRAVESGRYILRCGSTGISSLITPTGQMEGSLAPLTEGILYGELHLSQARTLYSRIGNLPILLFAIYVTALSVSPLLCRGKKDPSPT